MQKMTFTQIGVSSIPLRTGRARIRKLKVKPHSNLATKLKVEYTPENYHVPEKGPC